MAERRMFSKTIIDSDNFLELSNKAQLLYFHLALRADDDGFLNNYKIIMRLLRFTNKELNELTEKGYIISFENKVIVITHWKVHNFIRKDTYKETCCKNEKNMLSINKNNTYILSDSRGRTVDEPTTQDSIGKDSIGKVSTDKDSIVYNESAFSIPTLDEVSEYCRQNNYTTDAEKFIDYYSANGWQVGKNPMKDWKATLRNWERKENKEDVKKVKPTAFSNFTQPKSNFEEIKKRKRLDMIKKLQSDENNQQ